MEKRKTYNQYNDEGLIVATVKSLNAPEHGNQFEDVESYLGKVHSNGKVYEPTFDQDGKHVKENGKLKKGALLKG